MAFFELMVHSKMKRGSKKSRNVASGLGATKASETVNGVSSFSRIFTARSLACLLVAILSLALQRYFAFKTASKDLPVPNDETLFANLFSELLAEQQQPEITFVLKSDEDINMAVHDFNPDNHQAGRSAFQFLSRLASSPTFVHHYWHKRPLLIRAKDIAVISPDISKTGCSPNEQQRSDQECVSSRSWIAGAFTVNRHLRMVENSFITGFRTPERLRDGSDVSSWNFEPIVSQHGDTTRSHWSDFQQALRGGTIYFNAAGSLWPTLGGLCRLTQYAFGVPANVNVYATPANASISVPPHTDRQDVLVMQTAGTKHWRVYAPLKHSSANNYVDIMDRGKHGDVLTLDMLGYPLLDAVLQPGDLLYVPIGFPHTTDTKSSSAAAANAYRKLNDDESLFDQASVHLTMGLDAHAWSLTWAELRSTILKRSRKDSSWDKSGLSSENINVLFWNLTDTLPIGFLGGRRWRQSWYRLIGRPSLKGLDFELRKSLIEETKDLLVGLEPHRWKLSTESQTTKKEKLPSNRAIGEAIDYLFHEHLLSVLLIQEEFFRDVNPHDESTGIKAFVALQRSNAVMERFAEFSKNEALRAHYAQKRWAAEAMMGQSMQQ